MFGRSKSPYSSREILRHTDILLQAHRDSLQRWDRRLAQIAIGTFIDNRDDRNVQRVHQARQKERGNYSAWLGRVSVAIFDQYVPAMSEHRSFGPEQATEATKLIGRTIVSRTSQSRAVTIHNAFASRDTKEELVEGTGARIPRLPRFGVMTPLDILVEDQVTTTTPVGKQNFYGEQVVGAAFDEQLDEIQARHSSRHLSADELRVEIELLTGLSTLDAIQEEQGALNIAAAQLITRFSK